MKTSTTTNGKLPSIKTAVPGPKSKEIFDLEQKYIAPGRQRISLLAGLAFDHGEGATLTDADGNTYVDFFAGVAVASLGHAHPGMARSAVESGVAADGRHVRDQGARGGVQSCWPKSRPRD